MILLVGREEVFEISASYFDAHHEQSDSAFIGEMLTHDFVSVGDTCVGTLVEMRRSSPLTLSLSSCRWFVHKAVPDPMIKIDPQSCSPAKLHTLLTRKNCAFRCTC